MLFTQTLSIFRATFVDKSAVVKRTARRQMSTLGAIGLKGFKAVYN